MLMNILVLTSEYPNEKYPKPDWTWVVPYFCREWVKQGHQVIVVINSSRFPKIYYRLAKIFKDVIARIYDVSSIGLEDTTWTRRFCFDDQDVKVYNLPLFKTMPGGEYGSFAIQRQIRLICGILQSNNMSPDVITGHWINPQLRLLFKMKEVFPNSKTAIVFHGDYSKNNCKKHHVEKYIHEVEHVGCRSKAAYETIAGYLQVKNLFICSSGIPDEYMELKDDKKFKSETIQIFSAGRLVKYKNFDTVINSCREAFGYGKYRLFIAGDGPLKEELEEIILSNRQTQDVKLLGKLPREEVQKIMRKSDVFVLVSEKETFGLVYLEAMLQGCIVIASKGGGMDGIISDGENGYLCEEGNEAELEKIFKKVIRLTYEEKTKLSVNAMNTARKYSNSQVAYNYLHTIIG